MQTTTIVAASDSLEICLQRLIYAQSEGTSPMEALLLNPMVERIWALRREMLMLIDAKKEEER